MTDYLDQIEARIEAATEGPWVVGNRFHVQVAKWCKCRKEYGTLVWAGMKDINGTIMPTHIHRQDGELHPDDANDTSVYGGTIPGGPYPVALSGYASKYFDISRADAEFIAHAREDLPRLLAAVRAVGVLQGAEPSNDQWNMGYNDALEDVRRALTEALEGER